jgi:uncharacterized protein (TIGR00299 family) protein
VRVAYFDCFAGISGNMVLGAFLDAGMPLTQLEEGLDALKLPGWRLEVQKGSKMGITGTHVRVILTRHEHAHRRYKDIEDIIERSTLPSAVKKRALQIFLCLAQAEGKVHGLPFEEVHFHEVGAVDSIIDIVGAAVCLEWLKADRLMTSPVHVGGGFVNSAHGRLPVPAPATAELLQGIPAYGSDVMGELTTPTGAAILKCAVGSAGPWPPMVVEQIGYGLGDRDFSVPNTLRLAIGSLTNDTGITEVDRDEVEVIEANLDDMNPEFFPYVSDLLLKAGAVDVYLTPVIMKKGRPGYKITVLAGREHVSSCIGVMLRQTSTLGVRQYKTNRTKLKRSWVEGSVFGIPVRVKAGYWGEEVVNLAPEYEDCVRAANESGRPLKTVYDAARKMASVKLEDSRG